MYFWYCISYEYLMKYKIALKVYIYLTQQPYYKKITNDISNPISFSHLLQKHLKGISRDSLFHNGFDIFGIISNMYLPHLLLGSVKLLTENKLCQNGKDIE